MSAPGSKDYADLAAQLARLEERMETKQAQYETGLARLETRITRLAEEGAKRDKDNLRWLVGLWVAAIVVLGILIRWP